MYALVFWIKSKTSSVVSEVDLCPAKDEGEKTSVRYREPGKKVNLYRAKIIRKSDDEKYSKLLRVTTDGEILQKNNTNSNTASTQKQALNKSRKMNKETADESTNERNEILLRANCIGEEEEQEDESIHPDIDNDAHENRIAELERMLEEERKKESQKNKTKQRQAPTRKRNNASTKSTSHDHVNDLEEDPLELCRQARNGRVQICDPFNVWIDKGDLMYLQRWTQNPKEMTRRLMKCFIGSQNLKNMCARGRSKNTQPIPNDILSCAEYYVNKKCSTILKPVEFTNVINMMCATLRNPKKK